MTAVAVTTFISTCLLRFLPTTLADGHTLFSGLSGLMPLVILVILAIASIGICRLRARTPEELWLAVALVAALFDVWLTYWARTGSRSVGTCRSVAVYSPL